MTSAHYLLEAEKIASIEPSGIQILVGDAQQGQVEIPDKQPTISSRIMATSHLPNLQSAIRWARCLASSRWLSRINVTSYSRSVTAARIRAMPGDQLTIVGHHAGRDPSDLIGTVDHRVAGVKL